MSAYAAENRLRRWFTGAEHTKISYEIGKKVRESALFGGLSRTSFVFADVVRPRMRGPVQ